MTKNKAVTDAIQALKAVQNSEYGIVEDSVAVQLNQVIGLLESLQEAEASHQTAQTALQLFALGLDLASIMFNVVDLMSRNGR